MSSVFIRWLEFNPARLEHCDEGLGQSCEFALGQSRDFAFDALRRERRLEDRILFRQQRPSHCIVRFGRMHQRLDRQWRCKRLTFT